MKELHEQPLNRPKLRANGLTCLGLIVFTVHGGDVEKKFPRKGAVMLVPLKSS